MNRTHWIAVLIGVLVIASAYNTIKTFDVTGRVSSDEHSTCLIQARGLPAGHQLSDSMADIHVLLTVPRTAHSAPVPPAIAKVLADLNGHLAAYTADEATLPHTRIC